jgi:hypothetical protein
MLAASCMRILHTADWHLGHTLRDHSRVVEHAALPALAGADRSSTARSMRC